MKSSDLIINNIPEDIMNQLYLRKDSLKSRAEYLKETFQLKTFGEACHLNECITMSEEYGEYLDSRINNNISSDAFLYG